MSDTAPPATPGDNELQQDSVRTELEQIEASPDSQASEYRNSVVTRRRSRLWWLDVLIFLVLFAAALPMRFAATHGDLWMDEADYSFASVRGVQANRWDRSDIAGEPDRLVRLRHYHPPLVAYMIGLARRQGSDDRTLRVPFVLAGGLTIALVYLCGLSLFTGLGKREGRSRRFPALLRMAALTCAVIVLVTPAHIRASSHALPWAFITLGLMLLLWTLLKYQETRRVGWIVGVGAALGGLFVTSEVFYPALLATACAALFLVRPDIKEKSRRKSLLAATILAVTAFLAIALALWPVGLVVGSLKMLEHYVAMSHDSWPVVLRGQTYDRAPKWAYLYWYWHLYRPYLIFYVLGCLAALALLVRRRLPATVGALLAFTAVMLASAHKAHIIGPEYLVHCLPLLTLIGGLFFIAVGSLSFPLSILAMGIVAAFVVGRPEVQPLAGMDTRAQRSRWPAASRFLAAHWQPDDRMLAPQFGGVGRWYLLHVANVPAKEWQVQALPGPGEARDPLRRDVLNGVYRFVVVGSTFSDHPSIDSSVLQIVKSWPIVWRSDEDGAGPSRLVIYQLPPGVTHTTPLQATP